MDLRFKTEDEVVTALHEQTETIDKQIQAKEAALRRQEAANSSLYNILAKSEPVQLDHFGAWASTSPSATMPAGISLPPASRASWIPCPLLVNDQWIYIVREKVVIGAHVENIHSGSWVADISGAIIVEHDDTVEWQSQCRSCVLRFESGEYRKETNYLKPLDKALLVISCPLPSNFISSDLTLICQASVRDCSMEEERLLPSVLEPKYWRHWSGELIRIPRILFEDIGISVPAVQSVINILDRYEGGSEESLHKLLASLYVCQEQTCFHRLEMITDGAIGNADLKFLNRTTRYSRSPLFDGIIVFDVPSTDRTVVSGWTSDQVHQFARFYSLTSLDLDAETDTGKSTSDSSPAKTQDALMSRMSSMYNEASLATGARGNQVAVDGVQYREMRMDACANELLDLFSAM